MPVAPESREHLRAHRDELHALAGTLEVTRDELRADALLGAPITIAARRLDPDQETTR